MKANGLKIRNMVKELKIIKTAYPMKGNFEKVKGKGLGISKT